MLIQTMEPSRDLAPDRTMNPPSIQCKYGQIPRINHNPMDISAMLNPWTDVPEEPNNFMVRPSIHHKLNDSTNNIYENRGSLPLMTVEPRELTYQHAKLSFHLRAENSSNPQSSVSPCSENQSSTPTFNHGLPTPPPSSPPCVVSSQPSHHAPNNLATGPPHQHDSCWTSSSYSPRNSSSPRKPSQDPYWNIPVEVRQIQIFHGQSRVVPALRNRDGISKAPKRKRLGPHSNKAYTLEQVQWMRYFSADRGLNWQQVHTLFYQRWPGEVRDSVACITSRYYRSNLLPKLDANGMPMLDTNGKFVMVSSKVRGRVTEEGKHRPFHFLDLHPEWALVYDWVLPEHKERALRLLHILDGSIEDKEGKSQEFRNYQRAQRIIDGQNKDLAFHLSQLEL